MEVLLLTYAVGSFWGQNVSHFNGKPPHSIAQGSTDFEQVARIDGGGKKPGGGLSRSRGLQLLEIGADVTDVRVSARLTESAACLEATARTGSWKSRSLGSKAGGYMVQAVTRMGGRRAVRWRCLVDEVRILEGDKPSNPREFAQPLSRLLFYPNGGALRILVVCRRVRRWFVGTTLKKVLLAKSNFAASPAHILGRTPSLCDDLRRAANRILPHMAE